MKTAKNKIILSNNNKLKTKIFIRYILFLID